MGHQLLRDPPTTKEWQEVVEQINRGSDIATVANKAIHAVKSALQHATNDIGVIETLFYLLNVPNAARYATFGDGLQRLDIRTGLDPTLLEILAHTCDAIDRVLCNRHDRSDLGEMAQSSLMETLACTIGNEITIDLFRSLSERVQLAFRKYDTRGNFGVLAKRFFARFIFKCLDYFLSRSTMQMVGQQKRFADLDALRDYLNQLEDHCLKTAEVLVAFAGDWLKKEQRHEDLIDRVAAGRFAYGAMHKLIATLEQTEVRDE